AQKAFSVEMINSKASNLSPTAFIKGMDARQFFQLLDWEQFSEIIQNPTGEIQYISIDNLKMLSIYVQPIAHKEDIYYALIIKKVLHNNSPFSLVSFQDVTTGLLNLRALN